MKFTFNDLESLASSRSIPESPATSRQFTRKPRIERVVIPQALHRAGIQVDALKVDCGERPILIGTLHASMVLFSISLPARFANFRKLQSRMYIEDFEARLQGKLRYRGSLSESSKASKLDSRGSFASEGDSRAYKTSSRILWSCTEHNIFSLFSERDTKAY